MKKYCLLLVALAVFGVGIATADISPPYCNVAEMGSSFTGSQVSMVTTSGQGPSSMDYSVTLSGVGTASAWINAHVMEGRTGYVFDSVKSKYSSYSPGFYNPDMGIGSPDFNGFMQSVDLTYKEKTTASGIIQTFSKSFSVQL